MDPTVLAIGPPNRKGEVTITCGKNERVYGRKKERVWRDMTHLVNGPTN